MQTFFKNLKFKNFNILKLRYSSSNPDEFQNTDVLIVEKLGPVAKISINLPEKRNELDQTSFDALINTVKILNMDPDINALTIHGLGGNFCTGNSNSLSSEKFEKVSKKPLVAGITGYATGFGFELAMLCDLRVMEDTAEIGLGSKYEGTPSEFFFQRLVQAVGQSVAMDLVLTRKAIKVREATGIGLINRPVACGSGIGQAYALANCIAKFPLLLSERYKMEVNRVC